MIPNNKNHDLKVGGAIEGQAFRLSTREGDEAHLMEILRDHIYTDRILAVLREYGTNAWEANREAGRPDLPIEIELPTTNNLTLTIRDHGKGLSRDGVFNVFCQYGASTKRDSNDYVGFLGIGGKSGFAYSDTFTVISKYGGMASTYIANLDNKRSQMSLLVEEPCDPNDTGITIQIPVKDTDTNEFLGTAQNLFSYFEPRPKIYVQINGEAQGIELPEIKTVDDTLLKNGAIFGKNRYGEGWQAVMGCVPYAIDLNQVKDKIPPYFRNLSGIVYFDIGDVSVAASREELKYTDETKKAIVERITALVDEFVALKVKEFESQKISSWDKRLGLMNLFQLKLPIPDLFSAFNGVKFTPQYTTPPKFRLKKRIPYYRPRDSGNQWVDVYEFEISNGTRFVIRDETRPINGFENNSAIFVFRATGVSWQAAEKDFRQKLVEWKLDGVPITYSSSENWTAPKRGYGSTSNKKYLVSTFVLDHERDHFEQSRRGRGSSGGLSSNWKIVNRQPEDDDVYVIMENFEVKEGTTQGINFYNTYSRDRKLAKAFGKTMPAVYGYKDTAKQPVDRTQIKGIEYSKWSELFVRGLMESKDIDKIIELYEWKNAFSYLYLSEKIYEKISERLGEYHLICKLLRKSLDTKLELQKMGFEHSVISLLLKSRKNQTEEEEEESNASLALQKILSRYPLLPNDFVAVFIGDKANAYFEYVYLIDNKLTTEQAEKTSAEAAGSSRST